MKKFLLRFPAAILLFFLLPTLACGIPGVFNFNEEPSYAKVPIAEAPNHTMPSTATAQVISGIAESQNGPELAADPEAETGAACFGSFGAGVTCLDETGWWVANPDNSNFVGILVSDTTYCPDGRFVVATSLGFNVYQQGEWSVYKSPNPLTSIEGIACDENNGIWIAHFKGGTYFDGTNWTTYGADQMASGDAATGLVRGVAITSDGLVWFVTANSLASFDGAQWTIYQEGQGLNKNYFFDKIRINNQGKPVALHSNGLLILEGQKWIEHNFPQGLFPTNHALLIDNKDRIWVGTSKGLLIYEDNAWKIYSANTRELSSNIVHSLAVDEQGRAWVGTAWGLDVFDGEQWQHYFMHNANLADNKIVSISVSAGGPALPDPEQKEIGGISGKVVWEDDQPMANRTVCVCVEFLSNYFQSNPCEDQPFIQVSATDEQGRFRFDNIPAGLYYLAIESSENNWATLTTNYGVSERVLVAEGQTTKLDDLYLSAEDE